MVAWFLVACLSESSEHPESEVVAQQMASVSAPVEAARAQLAEVAAEVAEAVPVIVRPPPPSVQRPKDPYDALKFDVSQERKALAWRQSHGEDVTEEARVTLSASVSDIIDRWKGTRWSYSGTTTVPKKGAIACGYFVSTVLQHAGLVVDRVDLSRQASEQIIRSLVPDPQIERFRKVSREVVVNRVKKLGPGVYIAGLDTHIGFLVNEPGEPVHFCHSTERNRKMGVVCEVATESPSFKSRYTVLGRLGEAPLVDAWLAGERLPTARKLQPQAAVMHLKDRPVVVAAPAEPAEEPLPDFEWFYEDWASLDHLAANDEG